MVQLDQRQAASIAVAPFDRRPLAGDQALIAHLFLEDVIAELARAPHFEVLAGRTSLALSAEELDPRRMADAFGVTHLLDSSVRPSEGALEVKANLIETASGRMVWSHRYDVPMRRAGAVQEDIAAHVANHLTAQVNRGRLIRSRSRPVASLPAYDCWLRGHEALRRSTPEGDEEARELFERALAIDPTYARAYAGLSLTHYKRWNWRRRTRQEEEDDRLSLDYAQRAEDLDETDPVVQLVLGRARVYGRNFGQGRRHLERMLALSPNYADCLMEAAPLWAYLGEAEQALAMADKAMRLNPLHDAWYYLMAFMPNFLGRRLEDALAVLDRAPPNIVFEQSAFAAAVCGHLGRTPAAQEYVAAFLAEYARSITPGQAPRPDEAVAQMFDCNPFSRPADAEFLRQGLRLAGLDGGAASVTACRPETAAGRFVRRGGLWEVGFAGRTVQVADMKGCGDLALLLAAPRERIHCMEIAGRVAESDAGVVMDARARAECQRRIRDLQEERAEAERDNDFARSERLGEELDGLIEQLSTALGLGGRGRRLGDPAEKARTAVTWRIRSAMKKIAAVHPELGRHLEASIRTGAFCVYAPETPVRWSV
jgi:TolB-like protein